MFIALSFVGTLPSYIHECIYQIRLYFDKDIYLIIDDIESPYLDLLIKYNIKIINYNTVESNEFNTTLEIYRSKILIVESLKDRKELFVRSFERFFLLQNLMKMNNLENCLFLELDNLIYDNPEKWLDEFKKNDLCYMFDNYDRCSSGLMYIKTANSLTNLLSYILHYIATSNDFLNEMTALYRYRESSQDTVQILPTIYESRNNLPEMTYTNYKNYNTLFDALAIGCYLLGIDTHHTNGIIQTHTKAVWCLIDYTIENFEWQIDESGRKKPYIWNGEQWILINNLHVHSKALKNGLSKQLI